MRAYTHIKSPVYMDLLPDKTEKKNLYSKFHAFGCVIQSGLRLVFRSRLKFGTWNCTWIRVRLFAKLLDSPFVWLTTPMRAQGSLCIKPFRTFNAIVSPKTWKVFWSFAARKLCEMLGREEISFDLVDIPRFSSRLRNSALVANTHCGFRL